ncbi:TPA: AarF/ABC1/UbiB kinase family protein [Candidatus Poribacteria bacterium]|nr:AarF/ABC1/UbiB kinase family protein [Candidatus Poribacteria bacterium]
MRIIAGYRRLRRSRQIINVMVRNGFGGLMEMLRLRRIYRKGKQSEIGLVSPRAKRLRLAFEELGPTFIKMGQVLSTRMDLIPHDIFLELQKLQDQVPPVSPDKIRSEIESELKSPIDDIFSQFDDMPLASASIGQVHRATLKNNNKVAVKIQRPNIRQIIEDDLAILRSLAILAERHVPEFRIYNPVSFVDEFAKVLRNEMDYTLEARNMERFAHNFADDDTVYIPKVYWEYTTNRIITMEFIEGVKISNIAELKNRGYDIKSIARKGAEAYIKQIFVHRFFHGDPHPGNIYILPNEVIAFMDFGIVGRLTAGMAAKLNKLLIAVANRNPDKIAEALLQISIISEDSDIEDVQAEIAEFVDKYYDATLGQLQISALIQEMTEISFRYKISLDRQLNMLGRVLAEIEGIGRQLDPDFNIVPLIQPFAKGLIVSKISPREILDRTSKIASDYANFFINLPNDVRTALDKAKSGKLRIEFKHIGLENLVSGLERSTSRLAFAIIIAALVISSTLIISLEKPIGPSLFGIPIIGALGYIIGALSGLWLLINIIRNRTLS